MFPTKFDQPSAVNFCLDQTNNEVTVRLTMRSGPHRFPIQSGHVTFVLPTLNADFNSVTV